VRFHRSKAFPAAQARASDGQMPRQRSESEVREEVRPSVETGAAIWNPELYGRPLAFPDWRIWAGRSVLVLAALAGAHYLWWRLSTTSETGVLGWAFYATEAANYGLLLGGVLLFWRARWRTGPSARPCGTLDVYIPVCGEPIEMVHETLTAALAISYPHNTFLLNDGRIAQKDNWREVESLARRHGVPCFTRTAGKRGKAGNLNYALARTGGEHIAVIDADHTAVPTFAEQTLGYFMDPSVGFVCTPQQFHGPQEDPLNNRELLFYRFMQPAKDVDNAAFSCGNASIYRRSALLSIGGFSEWNVVEDLYTSYELHAHGWKSVYHPRPLTIGLAPQTGMAYVKQRLGWATDGLRIFFWDNPIFKRGLSVRQRLHYLHTTAFYLIAATQVLFVAAPLLHIFLDWPVMRPNSLDSYLVNSAPYLGAIALFLLVFGGLRGGLRAAQSVLSLAPLFLIAILRALTRIRFHSGVTEKARQSRFGWLLVPQLAALVGCLAGIAIAATSQRDGLAVSAFWAGWMALTSSALVAAVSVRPGPQRIVRSLLRIVVVAAVAWTALAPRSSPVEATQAVAGTSTGMEQSASEPPSPPNAGPRKRPRLRALAPPRRGAYIGVFNPDLLTSRDALRVWNHAHGVEARIMNWYQQWFTGERRLRTDWLEMVARQGAIPMITWEPWAKPVGGVHGANQPRARLALIARGRYDRYIRSWARAAAAYRQPLILRFMHEMNGFWYPWSIRANGNSERTFIRAWRHVHDIFSAAGALNVSWMWTVNSFTGMQNDNRRLEDYYPGSAYVDWTSMTGFNWGDSNNWNAWRSADAIFQDTYGALRRFHKPIAISEVGSVSTGGDRTAWTAETLRTLRADYRQVKAIIWFDSQYPGGIDFRLQGTSAEAFRTAIASSPYWNARIRLNQPRTRSERPPG
jgi:cellulose synthase (UDP-forming)